MKIKTFENKKFNAIKYIFNLFQIIIIIINNNNNNNNNNNK